MHDPALHPAKVALEPRVICLEKLSTLQELQYLAKQRGKLSTYWCYIFLRGGFFAVAESLFAHTAHTITRS